MSYNVTVLTYLVMIWKWYDAGANTQNHTGVNLAVRPRVRRRIHWSFDTFHQGL